MTIMPKGDRRGDPWPGTKRDEEIHDDGGPCRYVAGACNLCGSSVPPGVVTVLDPEWGGLFQVLVAANDSVVDPSGDVNGGTSVQVPPSVETRAREVQRLGRVVRGLEPGRTELERSAAPGPVRRGTTNRNDRGSSETRRRRREWLVATFRADLDLQVTMLGAALKPAHHLPVLLGHGEPACRCYRCGVLLTADTVSVDRIIPGCRGGTYRRDNIRPACGRCNSITGATTRRK